MGLTAKLTRKPTAGNVGAGAGEGWGMGFFLVFFPQEHFNSSPPFKSPTINTLVNRTNYNHILTKAQSTISICALLIFFTLLLFTLSTFEPNNNHHRRHLAQTPKFHAKPSSNPPALQGLGTLYTRGTKPMNDVVICHVTESVSVKEIKSFLRLFHRSGLFSKSDLLFIFPSISAPDSFGNVIREENELFLKLIRRYKAKLGNALDFPASFDVNQFENSGKKSPEKGEPIWGRKVKSFGSNMTEFGRLSHGSVAGFGVGELDPENSLNGFVDRVPMSLRRWASYPMILGRVRRNFKHVMLVDPKDILLLGDPLSWVRSRSPESVVLSKHNRRGSVNPGIIMGGSRGVRRLSAAMLTEIVRATARNKRKSVVTESTLLSRLVTNEFVQKSIRLVASGESIPESSSVSQMTVANSTMVRRGNSNVDIDGFVTKHICSFPIDSLVYLDCGRI